MKARFFLGSLFGLLLVTAVGCASAPEEAPAPPPPIDGLQSINGAQLYVKAIGQGPPIVVVHGGPGFDHSYFLPQLETLAEDYRLVFYDQRASGRSQVDLTPSEITLAQFVEDIEGLRELLGVERIHLLGHSFGGLIAMNYAVRHADRLDSLVLMNPNAASSAYAARVNQRVAQRITPEMQARQNEILGSEAFRNREAGAIREFLQLQLATNFHDSATVSRLNLYVPDDFALRGEKLQALAGDLAEYDLHDELAQVDVPTLIVRGASELLPIEAHERIRDALPDARLKELPDCGHFPFVECNEALTAVLSGFLAEATRERRSQRDG